MVLKNDFFLVCDKINLAFMSKFPWLDPNPVIIVEIWHPAKKESETTNRCFEGINSLNIYSVAGVQKSVTKADCVAAMFNVDSDFKS